MENKKIPTNFVVNGISFKVNYKKGNKEGILGLFGAVKQRIRLYKNQGDIKLSKEMIENTYFHELAHCLLWCAGGDWENELLVQSLGTSLQQYINSAEYE